MELISREDAIKDAESWVAVDEYEKHLKEIVIEWLKEFPPAHLSTNLAEVGTDVPDKNVGELISREQAIDAIEKKSDEIYKTKQDGATFPHDDLFQGMAYAADIIKTLPSAQPETTRRIVGKSKGGMTLWYECERCGEPVDEGDKFCRGCGAKMEVTE